MLFCITRLCIFESTNNKGSIFQTINLTTMITINNIQYTLEREGLDILCVPVINDDHTLILHDGYSQVRGEAYMQAKNIHRVSEIAADLMVEYVLQNESELVKIEA